MSVQRPASAPGAWLGRCVTVTVDRPAGSLYPRGWFIYPINYGFIAGTVAGDGEPVDCYVIDSRTPADTISATVVAVVDRADDVEDKLVAVEGDPGAWTREEIVRRSASANSTSTRR